MKFEDETYDVDNMAKKIDDIVSLGYARKQVLSMMYELPSLFGSSVENNTKPKLEFFDSIGLRDIPIKHPSSMIQSIALTYARYMYYKEIGYEINADNYMALSVGEKTFKNRYGVSKEELLERYDYSEYIEKKKVNKKEM